MEHKIKYFLIVYYLLILTLGLISLRATIIGASSLEEVTDLLETGVVKLLIAIPVIVLIMAVISIILIIKNKLSNIFLIHPVYYIVYFVIWLSIIPIFVSLTYPSNISLQMLDRIFRFDFIFNIFDIIFSGYMLHNLIVKRVYKTEFRNAVIFNSKRGQNERDRN